MGYETDLGVVLIEFDTRFESHYMEYMHTFFVLNAGAAEMQKHVI
jgi:hypothetical protein